jgi:hypothetical protein
LQKLLRRALADPAAPQMFRLRLAGETFLEPCEEALPPLAV